MITTTIEWHKTADELPENVGYLDMVLIYNGISVHSVYYSNKHKLFNASDNETEAEAKETAMYPLYWAYMPKITEKQTKEKE